MKRDSALDATLRAYDRNLDAFLRRTGHLSNEELIGRFLGHLRTEEGSLLSVGCGYGKDEEVFASRGFAVTGIDAARSMVREAARRVPQGRFFVMDMRSLGFDDGSFDGVWCNASLHHLSREDAPIALAEMRRVLRHRGVLFVNVKQGSGEEKRMLGSGTVRETFYQGKEMERLFSGAGFKIVMSLTRKNETDENPAVKPWLVYICRKA